MIIVITVSSENEVFCVPLDLSHLFSLVFSSFSALVVLLLAKSLLAALAPELVGSDADEPGLGRGDLQFLPCRGLMLKDQEGMFGVMQPSPVQGTHFGFFSPSCTRLLQ